MTASDWDLPKEINDVQLAFPAGLSEDGYLPPWEDIPHEFRGTAHSWVLFQQRWFGRGLPKETAFYPKEGVDLKTALRHLQALQSTYEPSHEHKEAAVAYLCSRWFEKVETPEITYKND